MNKAYGVLLAGAVSMMMVGCASRGYVDEQMSILSQGMESRLQETDQEVEALEGDVTTIREDLTAKDREISQLRDMTEEQERKLRESLDLAQEAVERAENASELVKGKLLYEVTLSDEAVPFGYDKAKLSDEAKLALDAFAETLIVDNEPVYIEIQGHTDNIGSDAYNLRLGRDRAESVMRYLHINHEIPLNRMGVFSYGEARPVAENKTEAGRAQNRRVVLLVME